MKRTIVVLVTLAVVGMSYATPIVYNASFELPDAEAASPTDEAWFPTIVDQGGAGWEFFGSLVGVLKETGNDSPLSYDILAVDGTQMGMTFNPGDEIAQTIHGFDIGQLYSIEWSERARTGYNTYQWTLMDTDTLVASHEVSDGAWTHQSVEFTATSTSHRLRFYQSAGGDGTCFIDDVSITAIPEPATFGLFGILGGGLLWVRKRMK